MMWSKALSGMGFITVAVGLLIYYAPSTTFDETNGLALYIDKHTAPIKQVYEEVSSDNTQTQIELEPLVEDDDIIISEETTMEEYLETIKVSDNRGGVRAVSYEDIAEASSFPQSQRRTLLRPIQEAVASNIEYLKHLPVPPEAETAHREYLRFTKQLNEALKTGEGLTVTNKEAWQSIPFVMNKSQVAGTHDGVEECGFCLESEALLLKGELKEIHNNEEL